jgi:uncharacterized protein
MHATPHALETGHLLAAAPAASPSPRDVIRGYLDAAERGDWRTAFGFYADDLHIRIPGRSRFAGEHRGKQAAVDYINAVRERYREGTIELEVVDVLAGAERVVLLVRERFTQDGETLVIRRANVYRIHNGRISAIEIYEGDQDVVDQLSF